MDNEENLMTYEDFIEKHKITMKLKRLNSRPDDTTTWGKEASHWTYILTYGRSTYEGLISMGAAHTQPPTLAQVLNSAQCDAEAVQFARDMAEFLYEFGYATSEKDLRRGIEAYAACQKTQADLMRFFGLDVFTEFMTRIERL